MRINMTHTVSAVTSMVASTLAAISENESSEKYISETENIPSSVRAATIATMKVNNESNVKRIESLRALLSLAAKNLESDSLLSFFTLPGVVEAVVDAANESKADLKERAKRSSIAKAVAQLSETLDKSAAGLPKEVKAQMLAEHETMLLSKAGLK